MPIIEVPADVLRDVRHAVKTAMFKHSKRAGDTTRSAGVRASEGRKVGRLRAFLDRLPDVKYRGGGE